MSPSALLGDRVPSCMLYSMVECRAWGSRTHPWPCRGSMVGSDRLNVPAIDLALSGHARQFRAETLCSAERGKGKGVRGPFPHGWWGRVLDFVLTHVLIALTMSTCCPLVGQTSRSQKVAPVGWGADRGGQNTGLHIVARPHQTHSECCPFAG